MKIDITKRIIDLRGNEDNVIINEFLTKVKGRELEESGHIVSTFLANVLIRVVTGLFSAVIEQVYKHEKDTMVESRFIWNVIFEAIHKTEMTLVNKSIDTIEDGHELVTHDGQFMILTPQETMARMTMSTQNREGNDEVQ